MTLHWSSIVSAIVLVWIIAWTGGMAWVQTRHAAHTRGCRGCFDGDGR